MSDWFFGLSVLAMAVIVFAVTYLLASIIFLVVTRLAAGERAKNFKVLTPAMLSPLGAVFALRWCSAPNRSGRITPMPSGPSPPKPAGCAIA